MKRALLATSAAALTVVAVDAMGVAATTRAGSIDTLLHVLYLLPWGIGFAALAAAAMTFVARPVRAMRADAFAVVLFWGLFAHYVVAFTAASAFRNIELTSLLTTAITGIVAVVCVGAYSMLAKVFARRRRIGAGSAGVSAVAVAVALSWHNREGLAQLDSHVVAAPVAAVIVGVLSWFMFARLPRVSDRAPLFFGAAFICACAAALAVGAFAPSVPGRAADAGPWSSWLARGVHLATDFDGDGASSFFGGADCAPWDPDVGPGKLEIPGDGIDNNCLGGDAQTGEVHVAPTWFDAPGPRPKNFLLVTVEALRPDHTTFGGYDRDTTPHLAKLAEESVVFENFYASSTFTRLSLPALLTSRTPSRIEFLAQKGTKMPRIARSNPWLPEVLSDAGFRTGGVTADFPAFTDKDSLGFDRGFDVYDTSAKIRYRGGTMRGFPARGQARDTIAFIKEGEGRFFAWVHFLEPHYKYEAYPGSPDFGDDDKANYDREIWGVDEAVGMILDELRESGLLDDTIVFVTGDHGEEFMEHGKRFHGSNLYEPQVRTVGLLWAPGVEPRRVEQPASLVDVAPTVANLLGVRATFDEWSGRNLTPLLYDEPIEDRPIYLETWSVTTQKKYMAAIVAWPYKGIFRQRGGEFELYDLVEDREEKDELSGDAAHESASRELKERLERYVDGHDRSYEQPREVDDAGTR